MNQGVTSTAKHGEIRWIIGAAAGPRDGVVDFQKSGVSAAWALALMAVAGENLASGGRWDGCFVPMA